MDLSPSFATDYLVWDNSEPVRIERARRGAPQLDATIAKRRSLTQRELAASGGVYTGDDCVWLVPRALLPPDWAFEPADAVVPQPPKDDASSRYVVLEANDQKWRNTWKLTCRNLVLNYRLRDTVQIERAALSNDAAGAFVKAFPSDPVNPGGVVLFANVPARVQLLTDEVRDERGLRGFAGDFAVVVGRQLPGVSNEDRVVWADTLGLYGPAGATRVFDIKGYHDPQRIDQLPVLDCELRP